MIKTAWRRPGCVLYDAISSAKAHNINELIVDTAVAPHQNRLMDELDRCAAPLQN